LLAIRIAIYQLESLSWVTNGGRLLIIEGNMQDGAMVLAGMDGTTSGEGRLVRGICKPVDGGVRETASPQPTAARPGSPSSPLCSARTTRSSSARHELCHSQVCELEGHDPLLLDARLDTSSSMAGLRSPK